MISFSRLLTFRQFLLPLSPFYSLPRPATCLYRISILTARTPMTAPQLSTRQMHNFALRLFSPGKAQTMNPSYLYSHHPRCPGCGSWAIHRSRRKGLSASTLRAILSPRPPNRRSVNCRRKFEVREVAEDHRRTTLNSVLRREVARVGAGFAAGVRA